MSQKMLEEQVMITSKWISCFICNADFTRDEHAEALTHVLEEHPQSEWVKP